jgi:SpoVK/Ycf46/Vps4 family AAA+-type ATPase
LQELNDMVGLEMVKDDIRITANRIRFLSERKDQGLPSNASANGHHIVLTGNPGTGKTTVARLLGRIYHQLGLISIGDVVVTERSKIVGEFIGQTEQNMQMIMRRAKGNVLFIDEAYSLVEDGKSSNDFGKHALECLLTMLSQPNPDMLVVLAGYEEPMMKMMQSNPGLPSRFPYHFHFPDYTECELMEICDRLLVKYQYEASDEVRQMLHKAIQKAVANKDKFFANARWIQQFIFEGVVPAMADRLAAQPRPLNRQQLQTILPSDVEAAVARMSQRPQTSTSRPVM